MAVIENLTAAERRALDDYIAGRWAYGRSTDPADRENAERQIERMYAWLGRPRPYMVWVDGPWHGFLAQALLLPLILLDSQLGSQLDSQLYAQLDSQLRSQLRSQLLWPWWGQFGGWWWSYFDFPIRHVSRFNVPPELAERCDAWVQLTRSLGHFWTFGRIAILSERMAECHVDDEGRLHRLDGPAMAYRDDTRVYSVHGVRVPAQVVEAPGTLTVDQIGRETNAEVRRVMVDRFGADRYLREAGARLVHEDEWGKLWRLEQGDDEPLVMVEVVNSTAEPDGAFKNYWLRVPPTMRTARAAVAWTFDVPEGVYDPVVQT